MGTKPRTTIRRTGPWSKNEAHEFLSRARIPMRLAANTPSGFPVVLSLWFLPDGNDLLAAVHEGSRIVKRLQADPRCGFEIAPNDPPYRGLRGNATVDLETQGAKALLERLLVRYLGSTDSNLGRFLLGRADEELVVRLRPHRVDSWDYTERMRNGV